MSDEEEALCLHCGICCHDKVRDAEGVMLIHPTAKCEHLGADNLCRVYEERSCLSREAMIAQDGILPAHCPYIRLRPGYRPGIVVSEEEFATYYAEAEKIRKRIEEGLEMLRKLDGSSKTP